MKANSTHKHFSLKLSMTISTWLFLVVIYKPIRCMNWTSESLQPPMSMEKIKSSFRQVLKSLMANTKFLLYQVFLVLLNLLSSTNSGCMILKFSPTTLHIPRRQLFYLEVKMSFLKMMSIKFLLLLKLMEKLNLFSLLSKLTRPFNSNWLSIHQMKSKWRKS